MTGECPKCGQPCDRRSRQCNRCRLSAKPSTPLRRWRLRTGKSYRWLARMTGLDLRTITRIAAGGASKSRTATVRHRYTGIPLRELLENEPGRWPYRLG